MARRSKNSSHNNRNRRDIRVISNPRLPLRFAPVVRRASVLRQYEDRRLYHPDRRRLLRPAVTFSGSNYALRSSPSKSRRVPFGVGFVAPRRVVVCVRRKQRREVLFAVGGAGSRKMRRPRRNEYSNVRC